MGILWGTYGTGILCVFAFVLQAKGVTMGILWGTDGAGILCVFALFYNAKKNLWGTKGILMGSTSLIHIHTHMYKEKWGGRGVWFGDLCLHCLPWEKARPTKIDLGFEEPHSLSPSGERRKAITLRGEGARRTYSKYNFFFRAVPLRGIEHPLWGPGQ